MFFFHLDRSLITTPSFSEKNDSEDETLQLQTSEETYPPVLKQSLNTSF